MPDSFDETIRQLDNSSRASNLISSLDEEVFSFCFDPELEPKLGRMFMLLEATIAGLRSIKKDQF